MWLSYAFGIGVVLLVIFNQTRIRPVPLVLTARLPVVVGAIGIFDVLEYLSQNHHPTGTDYLWVGGTLLVGAVLLGAVRAFTVRLWTAGVWVVRQGTPLTMFLWVLSLVLHFYVDGGGGHKGASGLEQSTLLLYLGLTIGVQAYVVHRRAVPLYQQLGPDAGRRLRVNFGSGPGGMRTVFATFRSGGQGFGVPHPAPGTAGRDDIIDAEVVEDEDPPELPHPH
jgi:hypothetical protein